MHFLLERGNSLGGYTDFTPIGVKITVISSEVKNTIITELPESVVFRALVSLHIWRVALSRLR